MSIKKTSKYLPFTICDKYFVAETIMVKYILKRIGLMFLTLVIIMTLCLIFVRLLPIPPVSYAPGVDIELQYKALVRQGYLVAVEDPEGTYAPESELEYASPDGVTKYYKAPVMQAVGIFWKNVLTSWDWGEGTVMYKGQGSIWNVLLEKLGYLCRITQKQMARSRDFYIGNGICICTELRLCVSCTVLILLQTRLVSFDKLHVGKGGRILYC